MSHAEPAREARLHVLLGASAEALALCLRQLGSTDTVLLADRGVEWLADARAIKRLGEGCGTLLALEADCLARALLAPPGLGLVPDAQWPALVRAHRQVLSWT